MFIRLEASAVQFRVFQIHVFLRFHVSGTHEILSTPVFVENVFARFTSDDGRELRHPPLCAVGFIGKGCVTVPPQAVRPCLERKPCATRSFYLPWEHLPLDEVTADYQAY